MSGAPGSVSIFFSQLRAGDPAAAGPLWQRYFPRLQALARRSLATRPQRATDADDAVQSAFISFWQRAVSGAFGDQLDRDDLWNLLGVITVRKAARHARAERADKRGGGRVVAEVALMQADGLPLRLDDLPGAMSAADFDLGCSELLDALDEECRAIAVLRLLGYQNREIAEQLDYTQRKVERKLNLIRMLWESE